MNKYVCLSILSVSSTIAQQKMASLGISPKNRGTEEKTKAAIIAAPAHPSFPKALVAGRLTPSAGACDLLKPRNC